MSKALGQKIAIKFTQDLIGDVTGNQAAFKVTGKELKHVNGELLDKTYTVVRTERPAIIAEWETDFISGAHNDTESKGGVLTLGVLK